MKGIDFMEGRYRDLDNTFVSSLRECTFPQILAKQAERLGKNHIAVRKKSLGIWEALTWEDYYRYVRHTSMGLLDLGLKRGEHLGLIIDNNPEWLFSQLGAEAIGVTVLNLFTSSVAKELCTMLNRFEASMVIVQDQEQVDKLVEMREGLSHLRKVIYVDPTGMRTYKDPWFLSFKELLKLGEDKEKENPELFERELWKGRPHDINLMLTTSGTTGIPKLVMLTHQGLTSIASGWVESAHIDVGDNWISLTPTAWIVENMWLGVTLLSGMAMNFYETLELLDKDFRDLGPTLIITSSRFWEDMSSKIRVKMDDAGWIKRKLYDLSFKVGGNIADRGSKKPLFLFI